MKLPLLVRGMHGLGDNLHQRAVLRQLMKSRDIWIESSWVSPYHDLIPSGLKVIRKATALRTQKKNAAREQGLFSRVSVPRLCETAQIWYSPADVRSCRSVLGAMCRATKVDYKGTDFRMPVPHDWREKVWAAIGNVTKPIMVYRPLVERTEWSGCSARNPDHAAYADLFRSIREKFFVVSLADLVPGVEWIAGDDADVDLRFHAGELDFETIAGLVSIASLVFCSPGFAVILAQAVETPVVCTFGSYERAYSFSAGARYSPYLGIEPINPCDDFTHDRTRDKKIDVRAAKANLAVFANEAAERLDRCA